MRGEGAIGSMDEPILYRGVEAATFIERPNRFLAKVRRENGQLTTAHVRNTGRNRELLVPGATVYLERACTEGRKTLYSLIAVEKQLHGGRSLLVNIDSQIPNRVVQAAVAAGRIREIGRPEVLRREVSFGSSRLDLYFEEDGEKGFIEVKGVTLEMDGHCYFPDAPTQRGRKHVEELIRAVREGYRGVLLFCLQTEGMRSVSPNDGTDPEFGQAVRDAQRQGVEVLAYDCAVGPDRICLRDAVPVVI